MEVSPYHYKGKDSFETLFEAASDNMLQPGDRRRIHNMIIPVGPDTKATVAPSCHLIARPLCSLFQQRKCQIVGSWLVKVILHCRQLYTSLNLKNPFCHPLLLCHCLFVMFKWHMTLHQNSASVALFPSFHRPRQTLKNKEPNPESWACCRLWYSCGIRPC